MGTKPQNTHRHDQAIHDTARRYNLLDQFVDVVDIGLRTVFSTPASQRPYPGDTKGTEELSLADKDLAARCMRINHAGEVAAQGLYTGQALTAKLPEVRDKMQAAASEENDHLNWCATRIKQLGSHTSYLDPIWYIGSVTLGALAGLAGDKWSLGFVAETERQVVAHLEQHLNRITTEDQNTRAVLEQMKEDEGRHATTAIESGGAPLPEPIKKAMKLTARIMTRSTYWI